MPMKDWLMKLNEQQKTKQSNYYSGSHPMPIAVHLGALHDLRPFKLFISMDTTLRCQICSLPFSLVLLLEFYILATSKIISGWLRTVCNHRDFIVLPPMGNHPPASQPNIPLKLHFPDTEWTSPFPILLMLRTRLGSDKYLFYKSLVWVNQESNSRSPTREVHVLGLIFA